MIFSSFFQTIEYIILYYFTWVTYSFVIYKTFLLLIYCCLTVIVITIYYCYNYYYFLLSLLLLLLFFFFLLEYLNQKHYSIHHWIDAKPVRCEVCNSEKMCAGIYCNHCNKAYCRPCSRRFHASDMTKNHTLYFI